MLGPLLLLLLAVTVSNAGSLVPITSCTTGRITYYDGYNGGACGYGDLLGSTGPGYVYIAALNEAAYNNAERCGICYELVGPLGPMRVMVTDECPATAANPVCHGDMTHFDLSHPTFPYLADESLGTLNITFREVACDVTGGVKVRVKSGSSVWWASFLVFNHRVGITSLDIKETGVTTWRSITRQSFNEWEVKPDTSSGKSSMTFPVVLRVTSKKGDTVLVNIPTPNGDIIYETEQFPVPTAYSSVCCSPPDGWTVVYKDAVQGVWYLDPYGGSADAASTTTPHTGSKCIQANLNGWGGLQMATNNGPLITQIGAVSFWLKTATTCNECLVIQSIGVSNSPGTTIPISTTTAGQWQHFTIQVSDIVSATATNFGGFDLHSNKADSQQFWVDDISITHNPSAPSLARCWAGEGGVGSSLLTTSFNFILLLLLSSTLLLI